MNIQRKLELAKQSIRSISQHDDADMAVRDAGLKNLEEFIEAERTLMGERVQTRIAAELGKAKKH